MVEQVLLLRSAHLESVPTSAGDARRLIRQALADVGEDAALFAAELAVSELVTNAVLHAATAVQLTIEVTATGITVSVRDSHPRLPTQRQWGTTATTGRGLGLVAALSDDFGVKPEQPAGKSVWFRLSRGAATEVGTDSAWDIDGLLDELADGGLERAALPGLPVRLWAAGQQHWEAVLRELYLYEQSDDESAPLDLRGAGRALEALSDAVTRAVETAGTAEQVDVHVAAASHSDFAALQDTLDLGMRLGAVGALLVRPALPEVVALRDWACEQVLAQANDVPATRWAGADHPRFIDPALVDRGSPVPTWDTTVVATASRAGIAADDNNRIIAVSPAAAELLGWRAEELVGRRVVAIVPPSMREAHVAGFTRHLTTGETHLLGVQVAVPALRADGTEIACSLLIERVAAEPGRMVYVAWIDPLQD